jgi:integrase
MVKNHRKTENARNLTEDGIRKIKPPATGRTYIYDTAQPALALSVTAAGSRTFYFAKRLGGKYTRTPVGRVGEITVQQAREAVAAMLGAAVVRGVNPVEEKRERRQQQARDNVTLGDLWTYYLANHARPHKKSWREDEKRYERHLAAWKDKPLDDIGQEDVERLHKAVGKHAPYEANRLRALLHKMFSLAGRVGFKGPNPVHGIERFQEEQRERFLQADELPTFFKALEQMRIESSVVADALEVALWTGARRGNVMSMRWEELALQRAEWTIPGDKHKNGKPVIVHLPPPALAILTQRQQTAGKSPWVFPGRRVGKHIQDPYKPWKALLAASGLKDLRPHDLRRTMGSWETATGASMQIIGKSLGHKAGSQATAIYARMNIDPVKAAVNKAVEAMQAAATASTEGGSDGKES